MSRIVTTFAMHGNYVLSAERQAETLKKHGVEYKHFINEYPPNSPSHQVEPYAFKVHAIDWCRRSGYKTVLWADAAVFLNKDPEPLFEQIEKEGYLLLLNGWNQANWSTDQQLAYFGVTRDEAEKMPHTMACAFGVSFESEVGVALFEEYAKAASLGIFRGKHYNKNNEVSTDPRVLGSRHDQTCLGFIANKLGLKHTPPQGVLAYRGDFNPDSGFILHSQGM